MVIPASDSMPDTLAFPFRLGHRPCLDGLRGLAVLAVVAAHLQWIPGGVVGVDMLLVLSGFLITVLLVEEFNKRGDVSLGSFYRKRFMRVLPPLVALLVLGGLASVWLGVNTPTHALKEAALALGFVSNWHTIHRTHLPILGHTWTLSLEVQFYLIWPVMLAYMLRRGVRRPYVIAVVVAGIVISAALRIGLFTFAAQGRRDYATRLFTGLDTRGHAALRLSRGVGGGVGFVLAVGLVPAGAYRNGNHQRGADDFHGDVLSPRTICVLLRAQRRPRSGGGEPADLVGRRAAPAIAMVARTARARRPRANLLRLLPISPTARVVLPAAA